MSATTDLPPGLGVREATPDDLDRIVEFGNRHARAVDWQDPAMVKRFEAGNPQPNRLSLLVETAAGEIVAAGQSSDGGHFRAAEGAYRAGIRVDPAWRRRGIGSRLLAMLEEHARAKGAPKSQANVRGDEPEGVAFATEYGYTEYHRRIDSYLDVPAFTTVGITSAADAEARSGARFATYKVVAAERGQALEAFQREMYDFINAQSRDIPRPDPMPEPAPFEAVRGMFFSGHAFDEDASLVALRDDRVVGITITSLNQQGIAYTQFTGTARDERGKGIALAMKLRAIEELKRRGAKLFGTTNDPANAAMRGINARLGYMPEPPRIMLEKKLG
ncbi:MAG: GNAT family N-acetyltransferase [Chloroflexota bacterium]